MRFMQVRIRVKNGSWDFKHQYQDLYPALQEIFCLNICLNQSSENICYALNSL